MALKVGEIGAIKSKRVAPGKHRAWGSVKLPDGTLYRADANKSTTDLAKQAVSNKLEGALAAAGHTTTTVGQYLRDHWLAPRVKAAQDATVRLPMGQSDRWSATQVRMYSNALHNAWPEAAPAPRATKTGVPDRRCADRSGIEGIGEVRLCDLNAEDVYNLFCSLIDGEHGHSAAKHVKLLLDQGLDEAVHAGLIPANPARLAKVPKKSQQRELAALSDEMVDKIHRVLVEYGQRTRVAMYGDGSRYADAWTVLAGTGMRIGELLALRIVDVLREQRRLLVNATMTEEGKAQRKHGTKNGKRRDITTSDAAWEVICRRMDAALAAGQSKLTPLFPNRRGRFWAPSAYRRGLREALDHAGIENDVINDEDRIVRITPHALRRTVSTRLEKAFDVRVSSLQLGNTPAVNEDKYVRRSPTVPDVNEALSG